MTSKRNSFPVASWAAALNGDIANILTSEGIERQEAQGQRSFVGDTTTMPRRMNGEYGLNAKDVLERIGFVVLENVDDLFMRVIMPVGWRKERTEHSMWSEVLDDKGRKRMSVFYKAAFYDTDAFFSVKRRYGVSVQPVGGWGQKRSEPDEERQNEYLLTDCGVPFFTSEPYTPTVEIPWYRLSDHMYEIAKQHLASLHPNHADMFAYWDEA